MEKQVRGFEKYVVYDDGNIIGERGKVLKPWREKGRYPKVFLGKRPFRKLLYVHKIVSDAFIPKVEGKMDINHIDGNKDNNHISNLERVSRSENLRHAMNTGLSPVPRGEKNGRHKLKEKDVYLIRKLKGIYTQKEIGKMFDVSISTIGHVLLRNTWKYLEEVVNV